MSDLRQTLVFEVKDGELIVHKQNIKDVQKETKKLGDESTVAGAQTAKGFGLATKAVKAFKAALAFTFVISGLKRIAQAIFDVGTAAEETESKFNTVFGSSAKAADEALVSFTRLSGATKTATRDAAATFGAILQGSGVAEEASAKMSVAITKLAGDFASFNNIPVEEAFTALRSGITGETEPLKRLGVVLRDVNVKQRALMETGKEHADQLTQAEIVQARLNEIMRLSGVQFGDLERTQGSTANRMRQLMGSFRRLGETVAEETLPVISDLINLLSRDVANIQKIFGGDDGIFVTGLREVVKQIRSVIAVISMIGPASEIAWTMFQSIALKSIALVQDKLSSLVGSTGNLFQTLAGGVGLQLPSGDVLTAGLDKMSEDARKAAEKLDEEMLALNEKFRKDFALVIADIFTDVDVEGGVKDLINQVEAGVANEEVIARLQVKYDIRGLEGVRKLFEARLKNNGIELPVKLPKQLSPAMQKLLEQSEDVDEVTGDVLDHFADMGRAILDAADSFGDLSEEVKGFANGILNAVDNFANLRQKLKDGIGGAALLSPTIGIAAGAMTAINSLIESRNENSERMRELSSQLRDAERGIARTINDLLTAGRIGGDTSGQAVQDSLAAIARLVNSDTGLLPEFRTPRNPDDLDVNDAFFKALQNFENLFEELDELGAIDIESFREQFERLVNTEGLNQAVLKTFYGPLGLITQLDGLSEELGGFGDSVTGAINKLDFFSSFLGTEGNAGAALFIEELRKLEGLPSEVSGFLDQLEAGIADGIDISSAEGQDFLNGLIEVLAGEAKGADFFGSITPEELEDIFNAFRGLAGGSDSVEALSNGIGDALDSFRLFSRFIETDLQEQFNRLFDEVLASGAEFSDELVDILKEAQALDLGTQKGRDRLQEIIAGLTEGLISGVDFGIPEDQLEQLLGLLQGLGAEAGSSEEATARQIISRIITEVTANELVVLANERNFILKDILEANRNLLDALSKSSGFGLLSGEAVTNIFNNNFDIQIAQAQNVDQLVESLETEIRRRMTGGFGS